MSEAPITTEIPAAADPAAVRIQKWNRAYKIAVIWLIGWLAIVLEKIVKLDSVAYGLRDGAVGGAFTSPFLLIITLPLAWLGSRIGSWGPWRRYRIWFTFLLPALYAFMGPAGALHERAFPQAQFQRFTGVAFPRDAKVERCIFDDGFGPFYDRLFTYEFTCSVAETDRLIRELKLKKVPGGISTVSSSTGAGTVTARSGWLVDEVWSGGEVGRAAFVMLQVDATRTKLRIVCGEI
jgi:hypothetical protein